MKTRIIAAFSITIGLILLLNDGYAQADNKLVQFENSSAVWSPKGYSQAAVIDLGTCWMVIISGQVPFDSVGNLVGKGNMAKQTEQVFINIKKVLERTGGNMSHLTKLGYFVTDVTKVQVIRDVRDKFINLEQPPTSTLVQVSKLFKDDVLLEVEATAVIPKK